MQLTWSGLIFVILAAAIAWFWRDSLNVREAANSAAMEACTRLGLQFLDGTVAFARLRIMRAEGRLKLKRTYVFDYTVHSIDRLQGFVVLLGTQIESVGFARSQTDLTQITTSQTATTQLTQEQTPTSLPSSTKVLDLDEWRRARQTRH